MNIKIMIKTLLLGFAGILAGCSQEYWIVESVEETTCCAPTYTPLSVGDVRQVVSVEDGATILYEIDAICYRTDGQRVYRELTSWGTGYDYPDTNYLFVRNGFLVYTSLEPMVDQWGDPLFPSNLYGEQVIAVSYPESGMRWKDIEGDPLGVWYEAYYEGGLSTDAQYFHDVYGLDRRPIDHTTEGMSIYYAPNVGWCGTGSSETGEMLFTLSYANLSTGTYGYLVPSRDFSLGKKKQVTSVNPFGRRILK